MTPEAFLSLSIKHKCYFKKAWVVSLFSIVQESEAGKANVFVGKLIQEPFGFFTIDEEMNKVKIETDKKTDSPLFTLKDKVTVTRDLFRTLKVDRLDSTIGILFINLIAILEPFRGNLEFINKKFVPSDIENIIYPISKDNPEDPSKLDEKSIYMDDYVRFCKAVTYLESFANIFTHSVTRRTILPAPGRKEFKKKLLENYEGKLRDPVEMAKFSEQLKKYDADYLKEDDSTGKFMSGKVADARVSAYMTQGGISNNFSGEMSVTPVIQALEDGIPKDQEGFTALVNDSRYGSFARGAETINGGVTAKDILRAADNWRISDGDCGATLGIERIYSSAKETENIVGRYLVTSGKPLLIENAEQAQAYINRKITLRSPQYCRRPKTDTCEVCAGVALSKYKTGLTIPLTDFSGGILADSLKLMHNSKLSTEVVDLQSVIS